MTTPAVIDPDALGGDALAAMAGHVVGPLQGGIAGDAIALDATGAGSIALPLRQAIVVVALAADLGAAGLTVTVALGGAAATALAFAPYSPRGAALAVPAPATTTPLAVAVTVNGAAPAGQVAVRYADGVLARLLHVLGSEKARIRTAARAVAAGRLLANATGDALDRLGTELGVARFTAQLAWDPTAKQLAATPATEPDAAYRARLQIYRPVVRPNRPNLDAVLAADAGGGLALSGYTGHVTAAESDTDLAIAIRVLSPPDDTQRLAYLAYVRNTFLLPLDATALPATRPVSLAVTARTNALLARLKSTAKWPAGAYIATPLAEAVDRAARAIAALGVTATITIATAQTDAGGSRYELGLGMDVARLDTATLTSLVTAATAKKITGTPTADIRALIAGLAPQPAASDPDARWLWAACGMRTVQPLATGTTTFVSHLPFHGAVLTATAGATAVELDAALNAPGDPSPPETAQLWSTIATAAAAAPAGALPWTATGSAATLTAIASAAPAAAATASAFVAQGIPTPATAAALAAARTALAALPADQWVGLQLDATTAAALIAGQAAGATSLASISTRLREAGAVSVLGVVAGATVYVLVGATDLPGGAAFDNRRTQWRWIAVALGADPRIGTLDATTSWTNHYTFASASGASASQLAAVIAVTPTRVEPVDIANRVDPYTVAIDAAGQAPLTFAQYEYLMNLLARWCPLGITIDTSRIRDSHVDVDGDGAPDLISQNLQYTFRPFTGPSRFTTNS